MGLTISSTVTSTVTLKSGDDPVLVTPTGAVVTNTNAALVGPGGTAWSVTNQGALKASGPKSIGVLLAGGGTLNNVALSNPSGGAVVAVPGAAAMIVNDDPALSIAPGTVSHQEGTGGTTGFTFALARTGATGGSASVACSVAVLPEPARCRQMLPTSPAGRCRPALSPSRRDRPAGRWRSRLPATSARRAG